MAIILYDNDSGAEIGVISDEDLGFLIENLEEETSDDQDYYLRPETLELLESRGASPELASLLRSAIGSREGIEIRWDRKA